MGQKVSPIGLRVGIIRDWDTKWYASKTQVADLLHEDLKIRKYLKTVYKDASVAKIEIEGINAVNKERVRNTLHTSKPGVVIGEKAGTKNKVVSTLAYMTKKEILLNVVEVKKPETNAELVAQFIAEQLEKRASFRRVQKIAIQRALKAGAKGAKTLVSGRLGGAEMARSEGYSEGQVPLHTLRADVDYATAEASTTYGKLGVKVWIYKGEVLPTKNGAAVEDEPKKEEKRPVRKPRPNKDNAKKGGQQ